jgi:hypothetical protein
MANYGTVGGGDTFFGQRLNGDDWLQASDNNKQKALNMATQAIDRLSFRGAKTDTEQDLEFPRGGDTTTPASIEQATYLIAIKFLQGNDPDLDIQQTLLERQRFGTNVEQQFLQNRNTPQHILVGIPSVEAWRLLVPYFRDFETVTLVRVD